MKIGTSLGKCVKDILDGKVDLEDVLFITAGTRIETEEQLHDVLKEYRYDGRKSYDTSEHDFDKVKKLGSAIWNSGILHQRRNSNALSHGLSDTWYDLMPSSNTDNEAVKAAWSHYIFLKKMTDR